MVTHFPRLNLPFSWCCCENHKQELAEEFSFICAAKVGEKENFDSSAFSVFKNDGKTLLSARQWEKKKPGILGVPGQSFVKPLEGKTRSPRTVPKRSMSSAAVAILVTALLLFSPCVLSADELSIKVSSWNPEVPESTTAVGQLCSSVVLGRYTYLFGGLPSQFVANNVTLEEFLKTNAAVATTMSYVDTASTFVGVPLTLPPSLYPPPWKNISRNVTNNASSWIPVSLPFPTIGPNNVAVVGSSIISLAMCNSIPDGVVINASTASHDSNFLRRGWRLTLVSSSVGSTIVPPSGNGTNHSSTNHSTQQVEYEAQRKSRRTVGKYVDTIPRFEIEEFVLPETVDPRLNASCVAHGANIYIVGGIQLPGGDVTSSVGMFDTNHNRYVDSVWEHAESVYNSGLSSDDSFLYIVGGSLAAGGVSLSVYAHHMASGKLVQESAYPNPSFNFPVVAVSNGIIFITGSPYSNLEAWSMRLRNGFPQVQPNSAPTLDRASVSLVTGTTNVTLGLFGGTTPNAGLNGDYYQAVASVGNSMWDPTNPDASSTLALAGLEYYTNLTAAQSATWLPNRLGNYTYFVDGYPALWSNYTFSALFDNASFWSICNSSNENPTSFCTVRLARSWRCDDPYVSDVPVSLSTVSHVTVGGTTMVVVGPFAPVINGDPDSGSSASASTSSSGSSGSGPPPIANLLVSGGDYKEDQSDFLGAPRSATQSAPSSAYVNYYPPSFARICLSVSPYQVPGCAGDWGSAEASADCTASFFVPMSELLPFVIVPSEFAPPGPSNKGGAGAGSSPYKLKVIVGVGCAVVILLIVVAAVVWKRSTAFDGYRDDDADENEDDRENALLVGGAKKTPTRSPSPKAKDQPQLLDGKYRVVQRLGKGSFSVVYLVERAMDSQRFALKYVQISDDTDRHEAMKECEVVHKLQGHPNVIQLFDMFMSYRFDANLSDASGSGFGVNSGRGGGHATSPRIFDTSNFAMRIDDESQIQKAASNSRAASTGERYLSLVMEYHERGDLGRWVRKMKSEPRIAEATVLSIAFQVLSVLNYMHHGTPPIIHRDLKPENILLSSVVYENMSNTFLPIVVTDFGLSRVMDKTFCETGVGSLPYVAPECWQRCYSTKVDIWAVGCILYAVCAKRVEPDNVRVMFSESSRPDFHKKLHTELHHVYGYSDATSKFIVSLLEVDPEHRPTAAAALKRIKKRSANSRAPRREVSDLDPDKAIERSYDSAEMGKDAQCEFYIPADTVFSPLMSGWSVTGANYGGAERPRVVKLNSGSVSTGSGKVETPSIAPTASGSGSGETHQRPTPAQPTQQPAIAAAAPAAAATTYTATTTAAAAETVNSSGMQSSGSQAFSGVAVDREHSDEERNAPTMSMKQLPLPPRPPQGGDN